MNEKLIEGLFETRALRIAPEDKPFWYTSGKLGAFYINTHFLYGSEEKAVNLLNIIDEYKGDAIDLHEKLHEETMRNYEEDSIFQNLINTMISYINTNIKIDEIEYISGGERRDWFFSLPIAELLNKKHITIFKDLSMVIYEKGKLQKAENIEGAKVLHIADLITEASSYERAWIPAVKSINGTITNSLVVIDRKQGGKELLEKNDIKSHALCEINFELFVKALEFGYINKEQCAIIKEYLENPDAAMKNFIMNNPDFISNALNGDDKKTAERAGLCIEKGFYK